MLRVEPHSRVGSSPHQLASAPNPVPAFPARPGSSDSMNSLAPGSPFLTRIGIHHDRVQPGVHPFEIPILQNGLDLELTRPVTFLVGENGSGKSTLLEALAWAVGF